MEIADKRDRDAELLSRALGGDAQAFTQLYRLLQGPVYRFALHMSGSAVLAEDVTQETFLALLREGHGFNPERGNLGSYLIGIARNQTMRAFAKRRGAVPLEDVAEPSVDAKLLDGLSRQQSLERVRRAVLALPEQYREVVVMCDLEEMSYADVAESLRCPVGTVRSRLSRARAMLLERLRGGKSIPARVLA